MRRLVVLVVLATAVLTLAGGVVLAESKTCAANECVGTREADTLTGSSDAREQGRIAELEGNDTIRDDSGALDVDAVNCGPGTKDKVVFDRGLDTIHKSCEIRIPG